MPRLILSLLFYLTIATTAYAGWVGPETVVSGGWGSGEGEFGFKEGYIQDELPHFQVDPEWGRIVVADEYNMRVKIFSKEGEYIKTFGPTLDVDAKGQWPDRLLGVYQGKIMTEWGRRFQSYDFKGNLVNTFKKKETRVEQMLPSGDVVLFNYGIPNKRYEIYSPAGKLISTHDKTPLMLGLVQESNYNSDGSGQHIIKYEDKVYSILSSIAVNPESLVRDVKGCLYGFVKIHKEPESEELHYRVYRFDPSGKTIGSIDLPENNIEVIDIGGERYQGEYRYILHAEYGPPVIGPDGSIYCYKRTPDTYSILKWTWIDTPELPPIDFTQPISPDTISSLDKQSLRLLRNTIFARHGRTFKSDDLKQYFSSKDWYKPSNNYSDTMLSEIDKANLELLMKFEAK